MVLQKTFIRRSRTRFLRSFETKSSSKQLGSSNQWRISSSGTHFATCTTSSKHCSLGLRCLIAPRWIRDFPSVTSMCSSLF
ncbi:hypothetical protein M758_5G158900 [Ceratodon purpureus]|nr:hypothetical protein M758_5G158900 [Ceratodon purpureus]